jgi:hypothetical protein
MVSALLHRRGHGEERQRNKVASMIRIRRSIAIGAFAAAAVAAPLAAALSAAPAQDAVAAPPCLAWYGNKEDGQCLGWSNGNGASFGSPSVAIGSNGFGVESGPLFPGQTINQGIGVGR